MYTSCVVHLFQQGSVVSHRALLFGTYQKGQNGDLQMDGAALSPTFDRCLCPHINQTYAIATVASSKLASWQMSSLCYHLHYCSQYHQYRPNKHDCSCSATVLVLSAKKRVMHRLLVVPTCCVKSWEVCDVASTTSQRWRLLRLSSVHHSTLNF